LGGAVVLIKPPAGMPLLIHHLLQIFYSFHSYPAFEKSVSSILSLRSITFTYSLLLCSEYCIKYRKNKLCTWKAWVLITGVHPSTPLLDMCYCIRPAQPFVGCGEIVEKSGLLAGNMEFNTRNEE
jgi:hypothetical protein